MTSPLIHIGYHKTGTIWLQQEVFCREDLGFCVPWDRQSHLAIEQFVLVNPFRFDADATRQLFQRGLNDAARGKLIPVITHQDLCGYPMYGRYYGKSVAERTRATFPDAKVLIGVREQRSALMSHYRQYVRQGESGTIEQFIGQANMKTGFAPICRLDHFEYDLLIGHYRDLFGAANVLVLPIELLRKDPHRYFEAICRFVGVTTERVPETRSRNVGWGGMTLKLRRWINSYHIGIADWQKPRQSLVYYAVDKLCRITETVTPAGLQTRAEQHIKGTIEQRCSGYFEQSNQRLSAMMGLDLAEYGYAMPQRVP